MSSFGKYKFLPWTSQGFISLYHTDQITLDPSNFKFKTKLEVDPAVLTDEVNFRFYKPSEIIGIDTKQIIRTEPRNSTTDFEPNYLAAIEFDHPSFPWLFSKKDNGKIVPWVTLIVVEKKEGVKLVYDPALPLSTIEISSKPQDELPDLDQLSFWAHTQVTGDTEPADPAKPYKELDDLLTKNSVHAISRIVCPRRLTRNSSYYACLVPTYLGAAKIIGTDVKPEEEEFSYYWDWKSLKDTDKKILPVYYHWEFSTGDSGDFEELVKRLESRVMPPEVGIRNMKILPLPGTSGIGFFNPIPTPKTDSSTQTGAIIGTDDPAHELAAGKRIVLNNEIIRGTVTVRLRNLIAGESPDNIILQVIQLLDDQKEIILEESVLNQDPPATPISDSFTDQTFTLLGNYAPITRGTVNIVVKTNLSKSIAIAETTNTSKREIAIVLTQTKQWESYYPPANPPDRNFDMAIPIVLTGLGLEGALCSPQTMSTDWWPNNRDAFQEKLKKIIDREDDSATRYYNQEKKVAPPLYASWQTALGKITTKGNLSTWQEQTGSQSWFGELNLDPRYRAIAGFGSRVIQDQQENLMASAWEQAGDIVHINQYLKQAQLARSCMGKIHSQIANLDSDTLTQITEPVHSLTNYDSTNTMYSKISSSRISHATSPAFRRITRKRGPKIKKFLSNVLNKNRQLLNKINTGNDLTGIQVTPDPVKLPDGSVTTDNFSSIGMSFSSYPPLPLHTQHDPISAFFTNIQHESTIISDSSNNTIFDSANAFDNRSGIPVNGVPTIMDDLSLQLDFTIAATTFHKYVNNSIDVSIPIPRQPKDSLDTTTLRASLMQQIDPEQTLPKRVQNRIQKGAVLWKPNDPLEPMMFYPEFPQPMYIPLRNLSQELLLPGLDLIPPNTVTLLKTNSTFIESYMVGLNDEMSSELLWREYPVDQRGTYFKQFWDVAGKIKADNTVVKRKIRTDVSNYLKISYDSVDELLVDRLAASKVREDTEDIGSIKNWGVNKDGTPSNLGLGCNLKSGDGLLVLLIRGDLLKRYPTAIIYATKSIEDPNTPGKWGPSFNNDDESHPIFRGTLQPDITFFGFNLNENEARGVSDGSQGYYFVIQEQATEPRFGLDEVDLPNVDPLKVNLLTDWNDLSWGHLAKDTKSFREMTQIRFDQNTINDNLKFNASSILPIYSSWPFVHDSDPDPPDHPNPDHHDWNLNNTTSANITFGIFQKPIRIAIHASNMLPEQKNAS